MADVSLRNVFKSFGKVEVIHGVSCDIRDGEFVVILGPSGCGKSTLLRMIAGLEEVTAGDVLIDGRVVNRMEPAERDIAMVFQNYALYPHMSVYDNMAFGLKLRKMPKDKIRALVDDAAKMLGLEGLLGRKPKELSGGQRQRVALGRAIVREPQVFLMDEPLSNLDAKLRVQTRAELIKLHRRLGITTVYVTHDQVEAMTMGDRIAVLNAGVMQQCDTPLNLYGSPANRFVAGFIGSPAMNFMEAKLTSENGSTFVDAAGMRLRLPDTRAARVKDQGYVGKPVTLGIRPEDIHDRELSLIPPDEGNTATVRVDVTEPMGDRVIVYALVNGETILASLGSATKAKELTDLHVVLDTNRIHLFDRDTERSLFVDA